MDEDKSHCLVVVLTNSLIDETKEPKDGARVESLKLGRFGS